MTETRQDDPVELEGGSLSVVVDPLIGGHHSLRHSQGPGRSGSGPRALGPAARALRLGNAGG